MNPPPQLLTPCAWTVHPLEGGRGLFAVALGARGLGAVTSADRGAVAAQRDQLSLALGQRFLDLGIVVHDPRSGAKLDWKPNQ